jgi:hypothetical protein
VLPRWATLLLVLLISLVWAGNVVAGMFDAARAPSPWVHSIFMVVVGAIFGLDKLPRQGQQPIEPPPPPDPATADSGSTS